MVGGHNAAQTLAGCGRSSGSKVGTFWLTEVVAASGPATDWLELDDGPLGWTLSGASA
jgi:hypothetical protein